MKTTITIRLDSADLTVEQNAALDAVTTEKLRRVTSGAWGAVYEAVKASDPAAVQLERAGGWLAGWNKPGYLPEDEPQLFDTFDAAQDYLQEELQREMKDCFNDCTASDDAKRVRIRVMYSNAIVGVRALERTREDFVPCGKYVWWIRPETD